MRPIRLDAASYRPFVAPEEMERAADVVRSLHPTLVERRSESAMVGWLDYPSRIGEETLGGVEAIAERVRRDADVFFVVGVGGSSLGARAALEFLGRDAAAPEIRFVGEDLSPTSLVEALEAVRTRRVVLNVVSKSGTTTEPAVAFRLLREALETAVGPAEARRRIIATTDPSGGALRAMAEAEGWTSFDIPRDVGGRFSVLTPVGLLPMAVAGIDVRRVLAGARALMAAPEGTDPAADDPNRYAMLRHILYLKGYAIELFVGFTPRLSGVGAWLRQLFAESEGKNGRGIFPVTGKYTTDLHSIGQYVQDGRRLLFETFLWLEDEGVDVTVPDRAAADGFDYLRGRSLQWMNEQAMWGTYVAHRNGGVPVGRIVLRDRSPETFGALVMFFERAVALSGMLLGVNPFDQPGVEAYKANLFALLGRPGYEARGEALQAEIAALLDRR
ncbi:MAG: glucose-6-phosphate isomerase [Hydrogenibacillus schlegelii]|uniref:Glucose-6-phosphate isomerase n=1 Tax=Hydrogenibacillus schlegelii TaxID=1484 RepID=A0A947CZY7_HYDSH|nr:glucose-6-phosphate isomerase [Hydrogenibacillus schlegelii]